MQSGPTSAIRAMWVAPWSWVFWWMTTSGSIVDPDAHPGGLRVDDRDALAHPVLDDAVAHARRATASWTRSLTPRVSTRSAGLTLVDRPRRSDQQPDHIGEVLLALDVVRGDPRERAAKLGDVEGVDAGVDLGDLARGLVGVALLDDRGDLAVGVADDPAVTGRVGELGGQDGRGRVDLVMASSSAARSRWSAAACRRAARRRCRRRASPSASSASRTAWPVPCCSSWTTGTALDSISVRCSITCARRWPTTTTVRGGAERLRGNQDVTQQAAAADRVQHLGELGLHPLALAGRKHDHGGRRCAQSPKLQDCGTTGRPARAYPALRSPLGLPPKTRLPRT